MARQDKKHKKIKIPKDLQIEILNPEQRWWRNIQDNATATIKQFEDSLKLQKEILELAKSKIKSLAS